MTCSKTCLKFILIAKAFLHIKYQLNKAHRNQRDFDCKISSYVKFATHHKMS